MCQRAPERIHLYGERLARAGVLDDVVGACAFQVAWHLGRNHGVRLGGRESAIPNQAFASQRYWRVHENDGIHGVREARFEEQRDIADHQLGAGRLGSGHCGLAPASNFGVDYRIKRGALGRVAEDDAAEGRSVEGAGLGEHSRPPSRDDGGQRGRPRGHRLARQDVRIHQVCPKRGKPSGHDRLSRRDVSRESEDAHHTIVPFPDRFRIVPRRRAFTLIEVLMVMALIGIVSGWAISRVNASGYKMDSNIRMLQNVLIGAQQTAITRNVNVQVMFDAANSRVRTLLDADNDGTASNGETVTYRGLDGARFLTPSTSIDGAAVFYMTGPGVIETGNPLQRAIRIAPNGALSGDVVVYLGTAAARLQDLRALAITGATARTAFWSRATGAWRRRDY